MSQIPTGEGYESAHARAAARRVIVEAQRRTDQTRGV